MTAGRVEVSENAPSSSRSNDSPGHPEDRRDSRVHKETKLHVAGDDDEGWRKDLAEEGAEYDGWNGSPVSQARRNSFRRI